MQHEILTRHIGTSGANANQIEEARSIALLVCVQNKYDFAHHDDDALIDNLSADGFAYVSLLLFGRLNQLRSASLSAVAARL